jgi:hypothetical protein
VLKENGVETKRLLFLSISFVIALSIARADDAIRFPSPDGKFAMLLVEQEKAQVKIQLIEVNSRKVVLDLADSGHPHSDDCKLLWTPDSQRVAFFEANRRGGDTTVYFRNDSGFSEVHLPELPSCQTRAKKNESGIFKGIESNIAPKEWLKTGALVVTDDEGWEMQDGELRGCTQTVTISFDANHKASVQRVTGKKAKQY